MFSAALFFVTLLSSSFAAYAPIGRPQHVAKRALYDHEAMDINLEERQLVLPPHIPATTTSEPAVLTYVTPSPSAKPIPITSQSQVVTSYVPQITVCALPPLAFIPGSFSNPAPTGPPFLNYSISTPAGSGTCLTTYSPTVTPICYTELLGIGTRITVTDCKQKITFSTDVDFVLETKDVTTVSSAIVTLLPYVRPLYTYYIAPWNEFIVAGTTPEHVQVKECSTYPNGTTFCVETTEVWYVDLATLIMTTTTHIDLTTTVKGPALVMVETFHMDITDTKTLFQLSTRMGLEYEFETLTTVRQSGSSGAITTTIKQTSTNTVTRGVALNTLIPMTSKERSSSALGSKNDIYKPTKPADDQMTTMRATTTLPGGMITSTVKNWNATNPLIR